MKFLKIGKHCKSIQTLSASIGKGEHVFINNIFIHPYITALKILMMKFKKKIGKHCKSIETLGASIGKMSIILDTNFLID